MKPLAYYFSEVVLPAGYPYRPPGMPGMKHTMQDEAYKQYDNPKYGFENIKCIHVGDDATISDNQQEFEESWGKWQAECLQSSGSKSKAKPGVWFKKPVETTTGEKKVAEEKPMAEEKARCARVREFSFMYKRVFGFFFCGFLLLRRTQLYII